MIQQILDNKELIIGKKYVYLSRNIKEPTFYVHQEAKFQNEQHKKDYIESQGAVYMLKDLFSDKQIDLHQVDYLEERYSVFPINKENLGFILDKHEFRTNKTAQRNLLKIFYEL